MKVSIVIPTHKRPNKVERAIESVLNQTYKDIEIIVISDGFDLNTNIAMEKYEDEPKVKYYYYYENKGANHARNKGILKSKSDIIAFLDDDDVWDSTKLQKQVDYVIKNPDVGLVYTGKKHIYSQLNLSYESSPKKSGNLSTSIFEGNHIGSTSCVMIRKTVLDDVGLFDENLPAMQDYDLWIRVCQKTNVGFIDEPLLLYINEDENSQISRNYDKRIKAFKLITKKYKDFYQVNPEYLNNFRKRNYRYLLRAAQRNKDKQTKKLLKKKYIENYTNISDIIFVLTLNLPFNILLKIRSIT